MIGFGWRSSPKWMRQFHGDFPNIGPVKRGGQQFHGDVAKIGPVKGGQQFHCGFAKIGPVKGCHTSHGDFAKIGPVKGGQTSHVDYAKSGFAKGVNKFMATMRRLAPSRGSNIPRRLCEDSPRQGGVNNSTATLRRSSIMPKSGIHPGSSPPKAQSPNPE